MVGVSSKWQTSPKGWLESTENHIKYRFFQFQAELGIENLSQSVISLKSLKTVPNMKYVVENLHVARNNAMLIFLGPVNFQGMKIAPDREVILMGQNKDG